MEYTKGAESRNDTLRRLIRLGYVNFKCNDDSANFRLGDLSQHLWHQQQVKCRVIHLLKLEGVRRSTQTSSRSEEITLVSFSKHRHWNISRNCFEKNEKKILWSRWAVWDVVSQSKGLFVSPSRAQNFNNKFFSFTYDIISNYQQFLLISMLLQVEK